jgi:uncharacterized protein YjeT (DUF2065 family)
MSITPFLVIGLTLVMLGVSLLIATGSWRRMVSRLAAAVHRH